MLRVADEFHGSHTGRQRRANEDNLYARAPLFAVADGMGGAQAGEIASQVAVETLASRVPDDVEGLAGLIRTANERIHELAQADERRAGMGTTVTAVMVGEDELHVAHVGDSRAYLFRDGRLEKLTRDHSLVDELLRQGKLSPEEAADHPQRSVITRAVGPEALVDVDTETWQAKSGDVVLVCSDGLTTMVGEPEIEALLRDAPALREAGQALIDAANEAGGRDNITVVLFRLEDVGAASVAAEQDTSAGETALRTTDVQAAVEAEQRRATATVAPPARAEPVSRRLEPVAPAAPPPKRRSRGRRLLVVLGVAAVVAIPVFFGVAAAIRSVYFVGADEQGYVTVFRGLPYELPLGIDLYETNYTSPITRDQVPAGRREAVLSDQELRSQSDAYDLVRQLERGELD
jgi:protein phosphatase